MTTQAELESQVRQLEARGAATADDLRLSRDREKALRERVAELENERPSTEDIEAMVRSVPATTVLNIIKEFSGRTPCVHCGGVPPADEVHWRVCPKHPAREALTAAEARVAALMDVLERARVVIAGGYAHALTKDRTDTLNLIDENLAAVEPPREPCGMCGSLEPSGAPSCSQCHTQFKGPAVPHVEPECASRIGAATETWLAGRTPVAKRGWHGGAIISAEGEPAPAQAPREHTCIRSDPRGREPCEACGESAPQVDEPTLTLCIHCAKPVHVGKRETTGWRHFDCARADDVPNVHLAAQPPQEEEEPPGPATPQQAAECLAVLKGEPTPRLYGVQRSTARHVHDRREPRVVSPGGAPMTPPTEAELAQARAELCRETENAWEDVHDIAVTERALRNSAEQEVQEWREAFASIDAFSWAPKPLRPSDLRAYAGGTPTLVERLHSAEQRAREAEEALAEMDGRRLANKFALTNALKGKEAAEQRAAEAERMRDQLSGVARSQTVMLHDIEERLEAAEQDCRELRAAVRAVIERHGNTPMPRPTAVAVGLLVREVEAILDACKEPHG